MENTDKVIFQNNTNTTDNENIKYYGNNKFNNSNFNFNSNKSNYNPDFLQNKRTSNEQSYSNNSNYYYNNNNFYNKDLSKQYNKNSKSKKRTRDTSFKSENYNFFNRQILKKKIINDNANANVNLNVDVVKKSSTDFKFSICSFNILAEHLVENSLHIKLSELDNNDPLKVNLNAELRINKIISEISFLKPEILGFQEFEDNIIFKNKLTELEYDFKLRLRPGKIEGCCLCWNKNKFTLINDYYLEFKTDSCNDEIFSKDNIAVFAVLKPINLDNEDKQTLVLAVNTHLLFNERRGDIKLAQIYSIISAVISIQNDLKENYIKNNQKLEILTFIMGDFNSVPNSAIYKLITTGKIDTYMLNRYCVR